MMGTGYLETGIQRYDCKLKIFTGWCCKVDGCEETAVTDRGFCSEHLVEKWKEMAK